MRKAQVWSMDLIIAVVIFLISVGVFYFFTSTKVGSDQSKLQIESQLVASKVTGDDPLSIVNDGAVDETKLNDLATLSYADLKDKLGVKDDFCIILQDQNGSIILIGNGTNQSVGIGNADLTLNLTTLGKSFNCSQVYT